MEIKTCIKESFAVIGKEGSTSDGEGFIQKLWYDANSHFAEVQHLAEKDKDGNIVGIWGVMSDFPVHSIRGKISAKDFILPEWNAEMTPKLLTAAQRSFMM